MSSTNPVELKKIGQEEFRIRWADGHTSVYPFRYLRQVCPCAGCRDEWTGAQILNPEAVADDLKGLKAELVGNYAIHFRFSDGHQTGIYSFNTLRKICPCPDCKV